MNITERKNETERDRSRLKRGKTGMPGEDGVISEASDSDNGRVTAVTERGVDAFRCRFCSGCLYEARLACACVVVMRL